MRFFGKKENKPQELAGSDQARSNIATGADHSTYGLFHLQRAAGNQAVQQILGCGSEATQASTNQEPVPTQYPVARPSERPKDKDVPGRESQTHTNAGSPLEPLLRQEMEQRFGHDFSQVRVHTDATAEQLAREVKANAYTAGSHIVFGKGQFMAGTRRGRQLIAHELTHVVQSETSPSTSALPKRSVEALESEANRSANAFLNGNSIPPVQASAGGISVPLRQPDDEGMTPAHAGGAMGELDAAFILGQRGLEIVIGPAGLGGHQLTEAGLDIVAYHPQADETWVVDNKASGGTSTVQSASAITRNLEKNLRTAIAQIRTLPSFPNQSRVVQHLESALAAVTKGDPIPAKVRLKITGAGGYHSGISRNLRAQGIEWTDLTGSAVRNARTQDIARAKNAGVRTGRPVTHSTGAAPASSDADTVVVRVPVGGASNADEPPTASGDQPQRPSITQGGNYKGGNFRAGAAAGGVSLAEGVGTLLLNQYLQEHYADYRREGVREFTDEALEKANPKFEELIRRHRTEIEKAQAQGRHAYLHVVIKVRMVDSTDRDPIVGSGLGIGDVPFGSDVEQVQVVYEGDPEPKPYDPDTWLIGDLFRGMFGYSARYSTRRIQIQGTNMAVRRRKEVVRDVEAMMTDPERPFEFERLLVKSQHSSPSKELLHEYAGYKRELGATSPFTRDRQAVDYWTRMEALTDAPIAELITQAKVALVPLDELRQFAFEQRLLGEKWGDPDAAARWAAVIQLIDAPLDERLLAEQQRARWARGPSKDQISQQEATVVTLEKQLSESERHLAQMRTMDARTQEERNAGEPPHPPWSKMDTLKKEIGRLREDLDIEKRLLKDSKKGK